MPSDCLFQLCECDYLQLFCVFRFFFGFGLLAWKSSDLKVPHGFFWWTMFLFTFTQQNTLCVSWRPNKGVGCSKSSGSVCKAKLCEPFWKPALFSITSTREQSSLALPRLALCRVSPPVDQWNGVKPLAGGWCASHMHLCVCKRWIKMGKRPSTHSSIALLAGTNAVGYLYLYWHGYTERVVSHWHPDIFNGVASYRL